jgi:hypothetical protein
MHLLAMLQAFSNDVAAPTASNQALNDALESNEVLDSHGITSRCTWNTNSWQKHPAHPDDPRKSVYSNAWNMLDASEWYYMDLNVEVKGGELVRAPASNMARTKLFHGAEYGSALKIFKARQGFIVGPGTHSVRGKSWSGLWCTDSLPDAVQRSDPERYLFQGDLTRFCCPIVIELATASVFKTVPQTCKHCIPGHHGQKLDGVIFQRVHFSLRFCNNYLRLEDPIIRARLCKDSFHCRRCACRICGAVCLPEDADYWAGWSKSGSRKWYRNQCHDRVSTGRGWL